MEYVQYLILIVVLVLIALAISKSMRKDIKIEMNRLVSSLGGKDNILNYEVNKSRFVVTLKDITVVNKDNIQKMGAKGIVEIDNQLKIILGDDARQLKRQIDKLK